MTQRTTLVLTMAVLLGSHVSAADIESEPNTADVLGVIFGGQYRPPIRNGSSC